jgi:hypothetical protein
MLHLQLAAAAATFLCRFFIMQGLQNIPKLLKLHAYKSLYVIQLA